MKLLYSLSIRLYVLGIRIFSLFDKKARLWLAGRRGIFKRLREAISPEDRIIWFHAASLGEFEQGRPLMEAVRKDHPGLKILLTFFSPSGYEIRKDYRGADYVCYLPVDYKRNAARFTRMVNPCKVFFIKYEYWYHYLRELSSKKVPVYLISAIFRRNQLFFRWYGSWYRKMLNYFTHIFVQDDASILLLNQHGFDHVSKPGDTRFDRVAEIARQTRQIEIAEKFCNHQPTVVCGSTWEKDEELLAEYINQSDSQLKFIVAPHEIHQSHISKLTASIKKPYIKYSEAEKADLSGKKVLIIDNIGMLSSLYQYGHWAYIGGGFGAGIHNILEAATFGLPVVFGPHHEKFKEALDLIQLQGAYSISGYADLTKIFDLFLTDTGKRQRSGETAGKYVKDNQGATLKIMNLVFTSRDN
ncbi:MAG: 3-deoxy-D-manno-octulosonic acid transferase [Bacteroidales bacterium]|nr:3-deoxy-D-manno-octulosonic acid transferase [Bacteroidales bacterium]